jgi:hypothetical protein
MHSAAGVGALVRGEPMGTRAGKLSAGRSELAACELWATKGARRNRNVGNVPASPSSHDMCSSRIQCSKLRVAHQSSSARLE